MPQTFDPYHRWLGIPQEDQPPNHYRLIGVNLFESDADVIDSAVNRQMAHLRTFQGGPHAALSQRLLNELAKARVCLLDTTKKAAYDICLRSTLNTSRLPPNTASPPPPPPPPAVNLVQAALTGAETQHENAFDIAELVQQASHVPKRSAQPGEADKPGRDGRKKRRISSTAISALVVGSSILGALVFLLITLTITKPAAPPAVIAKTEPSRPLPSAGPSAHAVPAKMSSGQGMADHPVADKLRSESGSGDTSETNKRVPGNRLPEQSQPVIKAPPAPQPESASAVHGGDTNSTGRSAEGPRHDDRTADGAGLAKSDSQKPHADTLPASPSSAETRPPVKSESSDRQHLPSPQEAKKEELSLSAITDLVFLVNQPLNRKSSRRLPLSLSEPFFFKVTKQATAPEHGFFDVDGKAVSVVWRSSSPRVVRVEQHGEQVNFTFLNAGKATVSVTVGKLSSQRNVEVCQLPFSLGISASDFIKAYGLADKKSSKLPGNSWGTGATSGEVWEYKKWPRCLITVEDSQIAGVHTQPL